MEKNTEIIRKKILDLYDNQVFNKKFNIIGDYDLVMKIASKHESCSSDVPSVNCSFHGENYSLKNRDEYVEEFNYWFKNINFNNENFFKKKKMICLAPKRPTSSIVLATAQTSTLSLVLLFFSKRSVSATAQVPTLLSNARAITKSSLRISNLSLRVMGSPTRITFSAALRELTPMSTNKSCI